MSDTRITRHYPYPPMIVWRAVTEPALVALWTSTGRGGRPEGFHPKSGRTSDSSRSRCRAGGESSNERRCSTSAFRRYSTRSTETEQATKPAANRNPQGCEGRPPKEILEGSEAVSSAAV
jgi:hypothetical protein